jgi:trans-aconitate methyltransferase
MARASGELPIRIQWCLDLVDVAPADEILEFGCGPGVAAASVADRLAGGSITAIDRSPTAIARTGARNAHHLRTGRLRLEQIALASFDADRRFDKAFGINVNLFWTGSADRECAVLGGVLAAGGAVHLVYELPPARGRDGIDRAAANLTRHGFTVSTQHGPTPSLIGVTGRLSA